MVELIVNNEGLDLADSKIEMSFQVNDIGELKTRQGDFSYEFELPNTQKNRRLLNRPEGINSNVYQRIPCTLKNHNELNRGFLQVMNFDGVIRANFYCGNSNWINLLEEKKMIELDLSEFDHAWSEANVTGSFANTEGYIYPYMDIDGNLSGAADISSVPHTYFYPAMFVSSLMEKIFLGINHKIGGAFLDTPDYKRLIMPFVKENFANTSLYYNSRSIYMGLLVAETNIDFSVHWSDDNTPFYNCDLYSQVTGQYTADGNYTLDLTAYLDITAAACFPITVSIRKNAVNLVFQVVAAPGAVTLNTTDQATSGDIYDVYILSGGVGCPATVGTNSWMSFIVQQQINSGDDIEMFNTMPDMKQVDLVKWLSVSFGLVVTYDEYSQTVYFNLFKTIKTNTPEDWSSKYVPKYELDYYQFINNYARKNYLRYSEPDDANLDDYKSQNDQGFGDGTIDVNNEFVSGIGDMFKAVFVPTWFEAVTDGTRTANISIYTRDDKPRILICITDFDPAYFSSMASITIGVTVVTAIPWAYFAKYSINTNCDVFTLNLSYDVPNILNANGIGLTDKYWTDYESILSEPIMLKAKFKLKSSDILNLDYLRPKYIEAENITTYWFLNRIKGYDFSDRKVECELVKIATRPTSLEYSLDPAGVEGLEWWFDNSETSLFNLSGALVDSQLDKAGNGYIRSASGAERPTLTGNEILYNGSHCLELNKLVTMLAFQRGEFFYVAKYNDVTASTIFFMTSADLANPNNQLDFLVYESAGVYNNSIAIYSVADRVYGDDSLENDTDYHILNWRSNGSSYGLNIDGIEQTINESNPGDDNGNWFGDDSALDNFIFACLKTTSTVYEKITDKEALYFREPLTTIQRTAIINYLKDKHGL